MKLNYTPTLTGKKMTLNNRKVALSFLTIGTTACLCSVIISKAMTSLVWAPLGLIGMALVLGGIFQMPPKK